MDKIPANHILVDTGTWIALQSENDRYHTQVLELMDAYPWPVATTSLVISETYSHLLYKHGRPAAIRFLEMVAIRRLMPNFFVVYDNPALDEQTVTLLRRFSDQRLTYVDAHLLAVAESLDSPLIFSVDHQLTLTGRTVLPGR